MLVTQGAIIAALMGIVPAALAQELSHGAMGLEGKVLLKTTRTANNKPVALPSGERKSRDHLDARFDRARRA